MLFRIEMNRDGKFVFRTFFGTEKTSEESIHDQLNYYLGFHKYAMYPSASFYVASKVDFSARIAEKSTSKIQLIVNRLLGTVCLL